MLASLLLAAAVKVAAPRIYVDGYGWVRGKTVGHCLVVVGAPHVDTLTDRKWEEFTDCVTANGG